MECGFNRLPDEIIIEICSYVNRETLGRLSSTCKRFHRLIRGDEVWRDRTPYLLGSNLISEDMYFRSKPSLTMRQRCIIGRNWELGKCYKDVVLKHPRCKPWLCLDKEFLFCSQNQCMIRLRRGPYGSSITNAMEVRVDHQDDITKSVVNGREIVSGGRDGLLVRRSIIGFQFIGKTVCHKKPLLSIDAKDDIIVTGCKDGFIRTWMTVNEATVFQGEFNAGDSVLSLALIHNNENVICGLSGVSKTHPLQLFDLERNEHIRCFENTYSRPTQVCDIYAESDHVFLCVGYDASVQLWDIRSPESCAVRWMDQYNNSFRCIKSDQHVTMVSSTEHNSLVHIWDKRFSRAVHIYKVMEFNSPAYSVAFDATYVYAAYDRAVAQLSFLGFC